MQIPPGKADGITLEKAPGGGIIGARPIVVQSGFGVKLPSREGVGLHKIRLSLRGDSAKGRVGVGLCHHARGISEGDDRAQAIRVIDGPLPVASRSSGSSMPGPWV